MLEPNSSYKIKFEIAPGEFDFGRATILSKTAGQIFLQIKTSKSANKILPQGTKLWFVQDTGISGFAGLWASSVISSQLVKGKKVLVCGLPKLKPLKQRRKVNRVDVKMPVVLTTDDTNAKPNAFQSVDLCRSGSKLETKLVSNLKMEPGQMVKAEFQLPDGTLRIKAQIIRIESNWLANKSIIALQFIALSKESSDKLDKLLNKLGGQTSKKVGSLSAVLKEKKETPAKTTRTTLLDLTKPLAKAQSVKAPGPAQKSITRKRTK